jgi:signal transduction histidine kinase
VKKPIFNSSLAQLALLQSAIIAVSAAITLGAVYLLTVRILDRDTDALIAAEVQGLAEQFNKGDIPGFVKLVAARSAEPNQHGAAYLLADQEFRPLAGNIAMWPRHLMRPLMRRGSGWASFSIEVADRGDFPAHEVRARFLTLPNRFHLLVGNDVQERLEFRRLVVEGLLWALTLTVVFALSGGWWLMRRVSKRAALIAGNVSRIAAGRLNERLPVSGSGDEIDGLVGEFNGLLDRVESLTLGMRAAVDSVAHDLRGPLVRLRTRAETALLRADPNEIRQALEQSIADVGKVTASLEELLRIAMAESGSVALEVLNLSEMTTAIAELYEPAAQEKGLHFEQQIEPRLWVLGHRQLLPQAIANLLDNAIKYTPRGSVVLRLERNAAGVSLTVADTGPGIPADQRERVLQRYVRLESTEDQPGSGLGLSLVAAVAKLHAAALTLKDNMPGLRIILRLRQSLSPVAGDSHSSGTKSE